MLLDYFKLREQPFGVTPDPRYWFASQTHREALASLLYGLEAGRGFVALIAKPGMGKTTLLFTGLEQLRESAKTVFLFETMATRENLLQALLIDLGVPDSHGNIIELQARLNEVCAQYTRDGKRMVVVIDEAQNLDESVLEFVRMLSNFETSREKLIHIVLSGQPQLAEKLALPGMVQLRQRISIVAHLEPLSQEDTRIYIEHRLKAAGYLSQTSLFTQPAMALIAEHSQGIPRNINNLCFNAMSIAFALKQKTIDCKIVREVIADLSLGASEKAPASLKPKIREVIVAAGHPRRGPLTIPEAAIREPDGDVSALSPAMVPAVTSQPIERDGWVPPIFSSHRDGNSPFRHWFSGGWFSQLAVVAAVIALVVAWALIPGWSNSTHVVAADANATSVPAPSVSSTGPSGPAEPPGTSGPSPVRAAGSPSQVIFFSAREEQSLHSICTENYPRCTPQILREIHRLNPQLGHSNYVGAGQLIRIPDRSIFP